LLDDRVHAPNERVMLSALFRGAEAVANLWRLLPEQLASVDQGSAA
jgi:acetylornithine deacetylase/succinyl-diaminopimelate desuccinylase-like protein